VCVPSASPQAVQAGAVRGTRASCPPIAWSSRVISAQIVSRIRRVRAGLEGRDIAELAGLRLGQLLAGGVLTHELEQILPQLDCPGVEFEVH
jgi:hypothetical protein